jgi:hypothetical protein
MDLYMGKVIYRIFILTIFYAILGFLLYVFFTKSFWIFSLIFFIFSAWSIWDVIEKNNLLAISKMELEERARQVEEASRQLISEIEAEKMDALTREDELQKRKNEALQLIPTYKSEYMNALKAGNKVLAYELGMRYYLTLNFSESHHGTENEIAQRVANEIAIYS